MAAALGTVWLCRRLEWAFQLCTEQAPPLYLQHHSLLLGILYGAAHRL